MKIRPVILCGGAGTRLWPESKNNLPKQFIDFGNWTLFKKTLERIKHPIFDKPIISTNKKYLNLTKKLLKKYKIYKYTIILEPIKKNTAAAILSSTLVKEISFQQPVAYFPSDHILDNNKNFYSETKKSLKKLTDNNIYLYGIKPKQASSKYGYLITNKIKDSLQVSRFVEKPIVSKAKKILNQGGLWNSGMVLARKISIINNFIEAQPKILNLCLNSVIKSKISNKVYKLNKFYYSKIKNISFDYAILEKCKNINALKIDNYWSDLGSWSEISNIFKINKNKYFKKKNVFVRPWGKYVNLYRGKNFLIKELVVNPKSSISLQKHNHRSEHWTISSGKPKITINKKKFFKKPNETVYIPSGSIHRIENLFEIPVKIMEVQIGSILKETDIVRYEDIYGRVN